MRCHLIKDSNWVISFQSKSSHKACGLVTNVLNDCVIILHADICHKSVTVNHCLTTSILSLNNNMWQKTLLCLIWNSQINIYARPQMADKLAFAAYVAPRIQAWYEQETGIPYGLPKLGECVWESTDVIWDSRECNRQISYWLCRWIILQIDSFVFFGSTSELLLETWKSLKSRDYHFKEANVQCYFCCAICDFNCTEIHSQSCRLKDWQEIK